MQPLRPLRHDASSVESAEEEPPALPATLPAPAEAPPSPPAAPPSLPPSPAAQPRSRRWDERGRTTLLINLASVMERVDEQLLPALYSRVGHSLHADPQHLGTLTAARAVVQALASPLAGVLATIATACG